MKTQFSHLQIVLFCLFAWLPAGSMAGPADVTMTPARFWAGGFAAAPRLPMVGDADGDGRADLLALYPQGDGIIDLARTSATGKPRYPVQARTHFGRDALVCACGRFSADPGVDVLEVCKDWSLHVAHHLNTATGQYEQDQAFDSIPPAYRLKPPLLAVACTAPDGNCHVLLADSRGRTLLLQNSHSAGAFGFHAIPLRLRLPHVCQMAAGSFGTAGRPAIYWMDTDGNVYRTQLDGIDYAASDNAARQALPDTRLALQAVPGEKLAAGRFRGKSETDVIVGQRLLPGGDPAQAITLADLPPASEEKGDLVWLAGDIDGDGKDDLVRVRRSGERFVGDDIFVHFAHDGESKEDDFACTSGDGLLDAWKTGKVKPGGLDLAALGCRVGHHDILVEVQRLEDVPDDLLKREMERAVRYFAGLPVANADGTKGIALHIIYREPIPLKEASKSWWDLGDEYHPAAHRGVTHWMEVYNGGGGQSGQMDDRGSCGAHALYATFLHEFGHQLGLDHTGHWQPNWCPIYPSLMNYAYSYQLNGKPDQIGYSDGRLASVVLDERHLPERLPLPPDKIAFLAGPPYHYRMKPTPDGKGTLIDWNWNGVFGEKSVAADINYGYSTTAGERHVIGKTYIAPVLVAHGVGKQARLLIFAGQLPPDAPVPPSDAKAEKPSLSPAQPGRLTVRVWRGANPATEAEKWSEEVPVENSGVTGDASAAYLAGVTWVAYPTASGVTLRPVTLAQEGGVKVGDALAIPNSAGAQATLTPFDGRLALLLWRDEKTAIGLRLLTARGKTLEVGEEPPLKATSRMPVGAVEGAKDEGRPSLWLGLSLDQDEKRPYRWQVRRFVREADGAMRQMSQEWIGGEKGSQRGQSRPILLRQPDPAFGPQGQLWFFSCGMFGSDSPWSCHYVSTRIADKTVNGGWLERRYYDEWTQSRSAPGVCCFHGEIIFAARWFGNVHGTENDNLFVAFYGRGIEAEPMGDFDDIGFIRDIGMSHSIAYRGE